ncbi:MAG: DUF1328 domain-containing protein [Candidatus Thermoplasmatota archaeon]
MEYLRLGIALLIIGILLSLLPVFGVLAGPLIYIGWILVVVGLVFAVLHVVGRSGSARHGGGRTL